MHCLTSHVWKYFSFCLGVEVVNELLALLLHCADQLSVHDVWKLVEVHAAREDAARSSPGVLVITNTWSVWLFLVVGASFYCDNFYLLKLHTT